VLHHQGVTRAAGDDICDSSGVQAAGGVRRVQGRRGDSSSCTLPLERKLVGTAEVLVVREGRCLIDLYDDEKRPVATREIGAGDVVLLVGGGHGFRMLEDTLFLEVKQGPYLGLEEKERF